MPPIEATQPTATQASKFGFNIRRNQAASMSLRANDDDTLAAREIGVG